MTGWNARMCRSFLGLHHHIVQAAVRCDAASLDQGHGRHMARESNRERRERQEKFQSFSRPKIKVAKTTKSGKTFIDYKDTESLKRMMRSEEHTSELQSRLHLVCRLLLEKKKKKK